MPLIASQTVVKKRFNVWVSLLVVFDPCNFPYVEYYPLVLGLLLTGICRVGLVFRRQWR